jgi:hypothetical protein
MNRLVSAIAIQKSIAIIPQKINPAKAGLSPHSLRPEILQTQTPASGLQASLQSSTASETDQEWFFGN